MYLRSVLKHNALFLVFLVGVALTARFTTIFSEMSTLAQIATGAMGGAVGALSPWVGRKIWRA